MNPSAYRGKVHEQVVTGCGCTVFGRENSMTLWTLTGRQPSPVSFYEHQFCIWVDPDHIYNTYAIFSFRGSKRLNTTRNSSESDSLNSHLTCAIWYKFSSLCTCRWFQASISRYHKTSRTCCGWYKRDYCHCAPCTGTCMN